MNSELMISEIQAPTTSTLWWAFINAFAFEALIEKASERRGRWWLDYYREPNALTVFAGRWQVGLSWRLAYSLRETQKRFCEMRAEWWGRLAGEPREF